LKWKTNSRHPVMAAVRRKELCMNQRLLIVIGSGSEALAGGSGLAGLGARGSGQVTGQVTVITGPHWWMLFLFLFAVVAVICLTIAFVSSNKRKDRG
jgi:hypothetical protein